MIVRKEQIAKIILYIIFFISPLFVTIFEFVASIVTYPLYLLFMYYVLFEAKKYKLTGNFYIVALLIFVPILLSLTIGTLTSIFVEPHGIDHSGLLNDSLGRIFNYIGFFFILYGTYILSKQNIDNNFQNFFIYKLLKAYWLGSLLIVFFGVWHAFSMYSGAIPFPFEGMRTNIHGTDGNLEISIDGVKRLTGICREPSYFAPILIDFILISLVLFNDWKKYFFVLVGLGLLLLSFSGGGYFNLLMIIGISLTFYYLAVLKRVVVKRKFNFKFVYLTIVILFPFIIIIPYMLELGLLNIIIARLPHILDIENHSRLYMVVKPFELILDSNIINIIFGHGIKSYYLLEYGFFLPDGTPFHHTSNNLFTDFLWEHGVVGLVFVSYLFIYLFKISNAFSNDKKYIILSLVIHLFSTSIYRGDYASSRFVIIIVFILLLINYFRQESACKQYQY